MEQAIVKIRETTAHTVAAYPTLGLAEDALERLAQNGIPTQFANIIATDVHARPRSFQRGFKKIVVLMIVGALAAILAELVTHYWVSGQTTSIGDEVIGWAALVGAVIGLIGALFLRSSGSRPLEADVFELMIDNQYAERARQVLVGGRGDDHDLRKEAR